MVSRRRAQNQKSDVDSESAQRLPQANNVSPLDDEPDVRTVSFGVVVTTHAAENEKAVSSLTTSMDVGHVEADLFARDPTVLTACSSSTNCFSHSHHSTPAPPSETDVSPVTFVPPKAASVATTPQQQPLEVPRRTSSRKRKPKSFFDDDVDDKNKHLGLAPIWVDQHGESLASIPEAMSQSECAGPQSSTSCANLATSNKAVGEVAKKLEHPVLDGDTVASLGSSIMPGSVIQSALYSTSPAPGVLAQAVLVTAPPAVPTGGAAPASLGCSAAPILLGGGPAPASLLGGGTSFASIGSDAALTSLAASGRVELGCAPVTASLLGSGTAP
eukprot:6214229-Pleurochrysis_carterae.AAC.1